MVTHDQDNFASELSFDAYNYSYICVAMWLGNDGSFN